MKRWTSWAAVALVFAMLAGCADAGNYVKDRYPLVSAQGNGSQVVKVYSAEGKDVPTVAKELASEERPKEMSKESADQMFLVYDNKIVNLQKDPQNPANTLVEIDSIQYAKEHYDSSFLQGYLTASILQSLFGGGWFNSPSVHGGYRGYSSTTIYNNYGGRPSDTTTDKDNKPSTSDRSGSFSTGKNSTSSGDSVSSDSSRKYDGSTPKTSNGAGSSWSSKSKPSTGSRSGSFSRRK
jgi:hypothetical protein